MQPAFPRRMTETLLKYQMLRKGSRVLVAFSGGADSLSLLCGFLAIRDEWELEIAAAHLDHGLRGELARADADWAESFCRDREIPFFRGYWPGFREVKAGKSPEDAARKARRRFLEDSLTKWPGDAIALGHHLDDQAETVLIHLMYGTGLRGMGGMRPVQGLYIRPLLEIRRSMILDYIAELGLKPRIDATNNDPSYLRNRLRLQVTPVLERCNPGFVAAIGRAAELARREDDYLDSLAGEALAELALPPATFMEGVKGEQAYRLGQIVAAETSEANPAPRLSLLKLMALDPVIAGRALRLWIARMTGKAGQDMAATERLYQLADNGRNGAHTEMRGGLRIRKEGDSLRIVPGGKKEQTRGEKQIAGQIGADGIPLRPGETIWLAGGKLSLHTRRTEDTEEALVRKTDKEQFFDSYTCAWPEREPALMLRCRRDGDWLQMPYGRKKLKDMFIEKKIPPALRGVWPLLACGAQVLWIPGLVKALGNVENSGTEKVEICVLSHDPIA